MCDYLKNREALKLDAMQKKIQEYYRQKPLDGLGKSIKEKADERNKSVAFDIATRLFDAAMVELTTKAVSAGEYEIELDSNKPEYRELYHNWKIKGLIEDILQRVCSTAGIRMMKVKKDKFSDEIVIMSVKEKK